jgi:DNA end-binding protein Ku
MQETGRVALARYAARGKQYLVMLRPVDGGIAMQQLYYADEVRSFEEVPVETADVSAKELDLAKLLGGAEAVDEFKPETYEDDVKKRILGLIQKKVEGEEISLVPAAETGGQIIDLMEALRASLSRSRRPRRPPRPRRRSPRARASASPRSARRERPASGPRRASDSGLRLPRRREISLSLARSIESLRLPPKGIPRRSREPAGRGRAAPPSNDESGRFRVFRLS